MAEKSGVDTGASPEADNAAALADAEKLAQEEFEKAAAKPAEGEEPAKTDEEIAAELFAKADAEKAAAEAAAAGGEQTDEEKAAAEAAAAEEAAKKAEEAAKVAEAAAKKTADDAETVHMRPSQKKAWNAMKAEREAARERLADQWLGFEEDELKEWLTLAGFAAVSIERIAAGAGQESVVLVRGETASLNKRQRSTKGD